MSVRPLNKLRKSATLPSVFSADEDSIGARGISAGSAGCRESMPCASSKAINRAFSACNAANSWASVTESNLGCGEETLAYSHVARLSVSDSGDQTNKL